MKNPIPLKKKKKTILRIKEINCSKAKDNQIVD